MVSGVIILRELNMRNRIKMIPKIFESKVDISHRAWARALSRLTPLCACGPLSDKIKKANENIVETHRTLEQTPLRRKEFHTCTLAPKHHNVRT